VCDVTSYVTPTMSSLSDMYAYSDITADVTQT
jgi:hypothetical protein